MSQSLAKIAIHLIFSTKNRERVISDEVRPQLHNYIGGILRELDCPAVEINSEPDHAHILFLLSRTSALSDLVGTVTKSSCLWFREQNRDNHAFHWQAGYGAFSVSESSIGSVTEYIRKQREHHQRRTFQDEVRALFRRHKIQFDERYVWE